MGTPLDDLGDRIRALVMASPKSRIKQRFVLTPKSEYPELRDLEKLRWDRFIAILLLFKKSQIQKTVRDSLPGAKRSPAGYLYTVFQTASDQLDVDPQATPLTIPPAGDWTIVNGKVVNV